MIKYEVKVILIVQIMILISVIIMAFITAKTFLDYLIGMVLCIANLLLSGTGNDE